MARKYMCWVCGDRVIDAIVPCVGCGCSIWVCEGCSSVRIMCEVCRRDKRIGELLDGKV